MARARMILASLSAALTVAAFTIVATSQSSSASTGYCTLTGMTKNRWIGGTGNWLDNNNWSTGTAPDDGMGANGYVCIPTGSAVTIANGVSANIQAIDVAAGATLNLETGSKLFIFGDRYQRPSIIRSGANLNLRPAAAFGGSGRLDLAGTARLTGDENFAPALSSRRCGLAANCPGPVPPGQTGLLVVGDTGVLRVNGTGLNLEDEYRIVVRGIAKIYNQGFIAADRGTTFELEPRTSGSGLGELIIANDGGYYEGRTLNGLSTLSTFINQGLIRKYGSTGTSVIEATYSRASPGTVRVDSGTIAFPDHVQQTSSVAPKSTYGVGQCVTHDYGCVPVTDIGNPENGSFRVPSVDTSGAKVTLYEDSAGPSAIGEMAFQVHATDLAATSSSPAKLQLRYDKSVLAGKSWKEVTIYRMAEGSSTYEKVLRCLLNGHPKTGRKSCVDRRELPTSSRYEPNLTSCTPQTCDTIMVIRTQVTSRWMGR